MPLNVHMISSGKQFLFILQSHLGVSDSLCEHSSSAFIFASTNIDQNRLASSEHFVNFPVLGNFSFIERKRCFAPSNLDYSSPKQDNRRNPGSTNSSSLQPIMPCGMSKYMR